MDRLRSSSVDPSLGSGCIAEVVHFPPSNEDLEILVSPGVLGFNNDNPRTNTIYLAVTNYGVQTPNTSNTSNINATKNRGIKMAVNIGTELVNNGNSGWTNADVMTALEKVFYEMGYNSGTQEDGVPICFVSWLRYNHW